MVLVLMKLVSKNTNPYCIYNNKTETISKQKEIFNQLFTEVVENSEAEEKRV